MLRFKEIDNVRRMNDIGGAGQIASLVERSRKGEIVKWLRPAQEDGFETSSQASGARCLVAQDRQLPAVSVQQLVLK